MRLWYTVFQQEFGDSMISSWNIMIKDGKRYYDDG